MAEAIIQHDWSANELGDPEKWPSVLKTTVGLVLASQFPQCIIWGPSLTTIPNNAFLPILGNKPQALGRPFSEVWSEVWPSLLPIVERTFGGEATFIEDFPLEIDRHGFPERAYFTFCYSPIRDDGGRVVGMLDTVTETTAKVELLERQALLSGELGHRLKNLLGVVQAVSSQTLRHASDLKSANEALTFRLAAFGRAADVLTASRWEDADLSALAATAFAGHALLADRFTIAGPSVVLRSQAALAISLALHELVTNATKYGAFSNDVGRVELTWSIDGAAENALDRIRLIWREIDGPPVTPPERLGFGSRMIERSLKSYFPGEILTEYRPDGLVLSIDAPITGALAEGSSFD